MDDVQQNNYTHPTHEYFILTVAFISKIAYAPNTDSVKPALCFIIMRIYPQWLEN